MSIIQRFGFDAIGGNPGTLDFWDDLRSGDLTSKGIVLQLSGGGLIDVISASGLGFHPNIDFVARMTYEAEVGELYAANEGGVGTPLWPAVAVGEFCYDRFLFRNSVANGIDYGPDHGMQCNIGDIKHYWRLPAPDSNGEMLIQCGVNAGLSIPEHTIVPDAPRDTVLRFERRILRTGTTTADITFRVYDEDSDTLLGEDDTFSISSFSATNIRQMLWGMSGIGGAPQGGTFSYFTGIAVRVSASADDWPGRYPVTGVGAEA